MEVLALNPGTVLPFPPLPSAWVPCNELSQEPLGLPKGLAAQTFS